MAKKPDAIYAPGELSRVREKLGVKDATEAKRLAQILGGEVGTERDPEIESSKESRKSGRPVETAGRGKRGRGIDIAPDMKDGDSKSARAKRSDINLEDDPSITVRLSYRERVKMDQLAAQPAFEIKNSLQVLTSILSFFREPVDYVNPRFVTTRMNEYYKKIENLVSSARNLFPKNNAKRNNQLKRASPFVFKIMDILRSWNIEQLASNLADLQAHPRSIRGANFTEVLRGIYRPLFILDDLNIEDMKTAFKLVYKILYLESPMDAKEKYQDIIRNILISLADIRRNVQFGLYPLLMKLISNRVIIYDRFFIERRRRFMAFLNVTEAEQLNAGDLSPQQIDKIDVESLQENSDEEETGEDVEAQEGEEGKEVKIEEGEAAVEEKKEEKEDPGDPKGIERRAKEETEQAEYKALQQGLSSLETLFPKAGWEKLEEFPDFYPYFSRMYNMKYGYELISPTDPLQQVSVMLNILDDLLIGLRHVTFGTITGSDGSFIKVGDELGDIINNWRQYIEDSFSRDYLPRLTEYCRMLENSGEARMSPFAKKYMNDMHWIKRLYFFPYYKFESIGPPPFQKQNVISIYSEIRKLRKYLTAVAMGIEQGTRAGGAKSQCAGINNPWAKYNFQVPNPISRRLDIMLPPEKKVNATLIFFSLSAVTVLDYIVNNENSWAYSDRPGPPFRSIRNEGIIPVFGVENKINTEQIFRDSLKKK